MHHSEENIPEEVFEEADRSEEELEQIEEEIRGRVEELDDDELEASEDFIEKEIEEALGSTGVEPDEPLSEEDEGEIQYSVSPYQGKVVINFGKEIQAMGLTPEQAKSLGGTLLNKARKAKKNR